MCWWVWSYTLANSGDLLNKHETYILLRSTRLVCWFCLLELGMSPSLLLKVRDRVVSSSSIFASRMLARKSFKKKERFNNVNSSRSACKEREKALGGHSKGICLGRKKRLGTGHLVGHIMNVLWWARAYTARVRDAKSRTACGGTPKRALYFRA